MNSRNNFGFVIVITMCFLLFSCSYRNSEASYVISEKDSIDEVLHTKKGVIITPPKVKYAIYTFIIDSLENFYFYTFPEEKKIEGVFDEEEPDRLDLKVQCVFSIPKGLEKEFFEKNVLSQKTSRPTRNIMIASFKDTINSEFLKYLNDVSNDEQNKAFYKVRLALPEEREVIKCKLSGEFCDAVH